MHKSESWPEHQPEPLITIKKIRILNFAILADLRVKIKLKKASTSTLPEN